MEHRLLSIKETCERTGLGRSLIYDEMRTGSLRSIQVGTRRLIPTEALTTWMDDHTSTGWSQ